MPDPTPRDEDGWALVPIEPTADMLAAGDTNTYRMRSIWASMLAARPSPPPPALGVGRKEVARIVSDRLVQIAMRRKSQAKTFAEDAAEITDAILSLLSEKQEEQTASRDGICSTPKRANADAADPVAGELLATVREAIFSAILDGAQADIERLPFGERVKARSEISADIARDILNQVRAAIARTEGRG